MRKSEFFTSVTALFAVLVSVVFISCGALFGDGQSGNVTINLPPISSQARAISSDKISDLKNVTTSYRVTANGITREGTGGTYTFTLLVGVVAEITVECLNSSGNVIVRAKKTHTVKSGTNNVDINLSRDGDMVETGGSNPPSGGNTPPAPPAPVQGQVTYNGNGAGSGTPSDTQNYDVGNEVTLQTGEPTRAGYTFAGWTSNVALEDGTGYTIPTTEAFVASGSASGVNKQITSFKMPSGGVVLTAKWTPITYTIKFNNGGGSGSQADLQFTVEDTNKALPTANEVTFSPPQGKAFDCWATSNNGLTTNLEFIISLLKTGATGNLEMSGNDITIYAIWEDRPDLTSTPVAGDIIMKDGTLKKASDTDINADDTIAVVYKVDSSARKVWAVGKVLSTSHYGWADSSADGYNHNLMDLREPNYSDGSTGLDILRAAVSDANGSDFATKYPAWDYACNYGTKQGLTSFQTGWYLPSIQELQEVYNSKATIENALAQTGVSKNSFESYGYWSSTQHPSSSNAVSALIFFFSDGTSSQRGKNNLTGCVCAVRQFTY